MLGRHCPKSYVGAKAEAVTDLKPWGKIRVKEQQLEARSDFGLVEAGTSVQVVRIEQGCLVVQRDSP
jgi:membrane-bound ClpP family serine protease